MGKNNMPYFPMFIDLSNKKVVVVGAGTLAKRRIRSMLAFTRQLVVVAPEVNPELRTLEEEGKITILRKSFEREDIYDAAMVFAATSDKKTNQEIYIVCKCLGIPVNVCDDKSRCDFYFSHLITEGSLVAGITSGGRARKQARQIAEQVKDLICKRSDLQ